jgi:hypothetical protein
MPSFNALITIGRAAFPTFYLRPTYKCQPDYSGGSGVFLKSCQGMRHDPCSEG